MKKGLILLVVILVIGFGIYVFVRQTGKTNSSQITSQQTTVSPSVSVSGFNKNDTLDQALQDLQTVDKNSK